MIDKIGNSQTCPMIHKKLGHEGYWLFCMKCYDLDLQHIKPKGV